MTTTEVSALAAMLEDLRNRVDRLGDQLSEVSKQLTDVRIDQAGLKVKAGMWGAIAGSLPLLASVLVNMLK